MDFNEYIDHTLLKADATKDDIINLCSQAVKYNFHSVCVNPCFIRLCKKRLADSNVKVCTVIGFPLGSNMLASKVSEVKYALFEECDEFDMVMNIAKFKSGDYDYVKREIQEIKNVIPDKTLKVIIETCLLTDEEKVKACQIALEANADFIKTSTGFSKAGANLNDIKLIKEAVKDQMKIKASGGIKTKEEALAFINAGCDRIGTSNAVKMMEE